MKIKYARNPGELVIDNPAKPKKRKKTMAKRKRKTTRRRRRRNPGVVKTGKNLFIKYGLAAAGALGSVRLMQFAVDKFGAKIPDAAKKYGAILIPAAGGVLLATKAKSEIWQGIAGGMVLASVNNGINALIPQAGAGVSDGLNSAQNHYMGDGNGYQITASGEVIDQSGNPVAQIVAPGASQPNGYLGEGSQEENWEHGETWTP